MNNDMNAPLQPKPAGLSAWISTWITAITKRSEQTYAAMAEHPDAATVNRAFLWVFLAGTISAAISGVLQALLGLAGFSAQTPGLSDLFGNAQRGIAFSLGISVCLSPVAGGLGVLFFAIGVGIVQWIASMFHGTGSFSKLAYTTAAISVPFTFVSSVLTPFSGVPVLGICVGLVGLALGFYAIALQVTAVKGVNQLGWGQALTAFFLPTLIFACCLVVPGVIAVMRLLGPKIGDTFSSINSSLP